MNKQRTSRPLRLLIALMCLSVFAAAQAQDLAMLSLEELMDLEVVVASRGQEPFFDTAAAISVLTRSDIERSGATSIPDVLRLVPGLQVARLDANKWAVSARGFNGRFASRLQVLVDGRSIYTTLFSGVHWEQQDLLLESVERIEVVRGPGGVIWGANAVNGVINIVTQSADDVDETLATGWLGTQGRAAALRSVTGLPRDGHLSWFIKASDLGALPDSSDRGGADAWRMGRVGVRADWRVANDEVTVQSEAFAGDLGQTFRIPFDEAPYLRAMPDDSRRQGGHVQLRWSRRPSDDQELRLQLYYDRFSVRDIVVDGSMQTWDADFHHSRRLGSHALVWGVGYRLSSDEQDGSATFMLTPMQRDLRLASAFVQDDLALTDLLHLKIGTRLEHHTYTGLQVQPNIRLRWSPAPTHMLWGSVARAVRTPPRAERDGMLSLSPLAPDSLFTGAPAVLPLVIGTDDFGAEVLRSVEAGWRVRLQDNLLLDMATFYNDYRGIVGSRLRLPSADGDLLRAELPVINAADVVTRGGEVAADWHASDSRARLRGAWTLLFIDQAPRADTTPRLGHGDGDNPEHQAMLWASFDPLPGWQADVMARFVSELPTLSVNRYVGLDVRVGHRLTQDLDLAISGRNLLDDNRQEFQSVLLNSMPTGTQRSVHAQLSWRP